MKEKHSCNALKVLKIIRIILSILLLSYTLSLCIIGHCADEQDYFPMSQNKNGHFNSSVISEIETQFNSESNYIFAYWAGTQGPYNIVYVAYYGKADDVAIYGEKNNDLIHFSLYQYGPGVVHYSRMLVTDAGYTGGFYGSGIGDLQNLTSSNYSTGVDYVSNFQMYTNNSDTRKIVLLYDDGVTIPEDDVAREDMEKPNIDNYIPNWTNTPTFDNSSVENALESVYNGIVWFANNVKDTITGSAEYMADTVRWSIQKVLDTLRAIPQAINEKIQEVKNAILTVVDKIQDTFDYISQPFDSTKINTAFNNMAIKSDYNNMTTLVNNAFSVFDSTAEPNTFRIPVHLENIPILHINEVQYIDLGWIFDSRSIIRAFMWCVTTFSLLYTIIDALPSYLQGNDE